MFKGAKKDDLKLVASELNIKIEDKNTVFEIIELIKNSEEYKKDPESVKEIANTIIEERKSKDLSEIELEKLKLERLKIELELANLQNSNSENKNDSQYSLDTLIKSVRTLTIKLPSKPEGWAYFFASLERAFQTKNVPEKLKSEVLLNLLGERASNILIYIKDEDISNYEKIKSIVLREFEPTPQICLENFRKAQRLPNETHVMYASRLMTDFEYYLKLRKVSDFETLKQLIVSDKLFQNLDKETSTHINIKSAESWLAPLELAKECDLYFASRGKPLTENNSSAKNPKQTKFSFGKWGKNESKVFLSDVQNCILCKSNNHLNLSKCPVFKNKTVNQRVEIIKSHNCCFNCLSPNHTAKSCKSKFSCSECKKKHHILLHFPREVIRDTETSRVISAPLSPDAKEFMMSNKTYQCSSDQLITATSAFENKINTVLLSTVNCLVKDNTGNFQNIRALLDGGSMSNLISKRCADKLQLKKNKINIIVSCLNDSSLPVRGSVKTKIANKERTYERELEFLIVPKITNLIPSKVLNVQFEGLEYLPLADTKFNIPNDVEILLGAQVFFELLKPEQLYPENSQLILQNTVFGYVVSGSIEVPTQDSEIHCGLIKEEDLNENLKKFWEIENINESMELNSETKICEEHYTRTHMRDENGRYVVQMPLKEEPSCLGDSKQIALKRLNSLWNRLEKDKVYSELYKNFLREYQELGHMIETNEVQEQNGSYYIPHLGIYRGIEKSISTPLRVVFNASSPTTNGKSLNSIQYNGGVIQDDLFSIMLRFRKHIFAFTADITKMYRMIAIHPKQRKLQKILWKEGVDEQIKTYELTTVTYGTVSAPYLAMRTIKQIAIDEGNNFPLAKSVLQDDFYMDDVLSGAPTLKEAKELQKQLISILQKAGMNLHKWCANNYELSPELGNNYSFSNPVETKTLGVSWKPIDDCFSFRVEIEPAESYTKRRVLSTIARLFDPLGLLGPIITKAKIFMQKLWQLKIDWNDPLPEDEYREWHKFLMSLEHINKINIERRIVIEEPINIEIHGFADASESCYGAAVYCKSTNSSSNVLVRLIASKSRVAPLKRLTIPRLELSAAVLLAKLVKKVLIALKLKISQVYLWSDSMIVLAWIQKEPTNLKTFVQNRVAIIQELTCVNQWHHVASDQNPADLLSRGTEPTKLLQHAMWFEGPMFLSTGDYPDRSISVSENCKQFDCELKNSSSKISVLTLNNTNFLYQLLNLSNNYLTIIHILSFIFRFIKNCKEKTRVTGPLTSKELETAEIFLIKNIQQVEFQEEIKNLRKNNHVSPKSNLKYLNPFLDQNDILRVGGRLVKSNLEFDNKHQIILPKGNKLTKLIFQNFHKKYFHIGPQGLLHYVRMKFWPINGKNLARKIVHECVTCFKINPVTSNQIMGNLPAERITPNYPFNHTGVDFCGPFEIKYKYQRKGVYQKIYVAIFVCLVTKAIHIEIVSDLTSDAFIATLKRFFARRGKSASIMSDNASNFKGACSEINKLHNLIKKPDENVANYLSSECIDWKFIPPRSPNFGGLWEAGVKSFKYFLKRTLKGSKLTIEEFETLTTQIEGILNSRPLTPLSSDINDFQALTPAHFLIGRPIVAIPEPQFIDIHETRLSKWQRISKFMQLIWKNWSLNYLSHLQNRSKWQFEKNNITPGMMVLVKEDNLPPYKWLLGRILEVIPGSDGKIRVVKVKTQTNIFTRSISKICILPIN